MPNYILIIIIIIADLAVVGERGSLKDVVTQCILENMNKNIGNLCVCT